MSQQPLAASAVTLNGITVNPEGPKRSRDAQNTNYIYLVASVSTGFTIEQLQILDNLGAHIYECHGDVYLSRYDPPDLAPLRRLDFVSVANCYHTNFKVPASVQNVLDQVPMGMAGVSGGAAPPEVTSITLDLILHSSGSIDAANAVAGGLREIPGVEMESISVGPGLVTVRAAVNAVEAIKRLDEVRTIAREVPATLLNNVATLGERSYLSKADNADIHAKALTPPDSLYRGSGQVVSVNDSGLDLGSIEDIHPDFKGRVRAIIPFSGAPSGEDTNSHGTHVAGSVLGSGTSSTMGGVIEGTAPGAELVMQKVVDAGGAFKPGNSYITLLQGPYSNYNSRISSNSWGLLWSATLPYGQSARAISLDQFVWDHQDQVVCVAAGNDGEVKTSAAQVSDASAAKNCITVGCTYSSRPTTGVSFNAASVNPSDPTVIAPFSSRGPTVEQRIKPDVTAPGVAILSTCSRSPAITAGIKSRFGVSMDPLYMFDSGTSMATPLVAGCCAVLRQMLDANGYSEPSAALVKALLINGAMSDGELHNDRSKASVRPTPEFGFGRVDLERAMVVPLAQEEGGILDEKVGIKAGGVSARFTLPILTGRQTIKVTLVWSDPPAATIKNNLYLELHVNNTLVPGLTIPVANATQPGAPTNNVQQIIQHNLWVGRRWAVVVRAGTFLPVNAVQPFAVVWSLSA